LLDRRMVATARRCLAEGEVILAMVEAGDEFRRADAHFVRDIARLGRPTVIAINKIDTGPRERLLKLAEQAYQTMPTAEIVPISALRGENLEELVRVLKQLLPVSPPLMDEEEYTDQTERMIAEEILREKLFLAMRHEIPFSTAVTVESFTEEGQGNLIKIAALVIVERESQKGMVIGAGGQKLKEIGTGARLELETLLDRRIFLELRVKVEKGWTRDPRKLKELGF